MKLFEKLKAELQNVPSGVYSPLYLESLGIKDGYCDSFPVMRAKGVQSIFLGIKPCILKNEIIAGNFFGAYIVKDSVLIENAQRIMKNVGKRSFITNSDHYAPNYRHVLRVGISGLIKEIEESLTTHKNDEKKCEYLSSMKMCLSAFTEMIKSYAEKADSLRDNIEYDNQKLSFIADNCRAIAEDAPKTFAQALQLIWLCHLAFIFEGRYAMAIGRLDQYLYPFYKNDVEKGILDKDKALELLENTFAKFSASDVQNVCIGGYNKDGSCSINDVSYLIIEAVRNNNAPGPNLSLRYTHNTPDDLLDKALQSIGTGLGYPAMMNDRVNIEALRKYGYDEDDIYDYCMVGCIENFITGKQPPWSDGRFDTPKCFDYVLNGGISRFNNTAGLEESDASEIKSMKEFMQHFEKQIAFAFDEYCIGFQCKNRVDGEYYPSPFLSCFCDNCIERGLDINCGGAKYPSVHGVGNTGIGTTCDSLAAIEKVVFVDKAATLCELRDALNKNFRGYEELRSKLLSAPKYGNNDDFADKYAVWYVDFFAKLSKRHKTYDGGGIYSAMASNISNISAGKLINATPDGRLAGEPLSDAGSPTYGKDKSGVTATLMSVSKPDYTGVACGSVVNQKFPPSVFEDGTRQKLLSLIKTYFALGGQELQINSTSREILEEAMENPEKYASLVVRVSGFSDSYTRLDQSVQLDILSRTQQTI